MEHQHQKQQYTRLMHPEINQDGPGNCPLCGVNLVPIKKNGEEEVPAAKLVQLGHSKMKMDDEPLKQQQGKQYTCRMHPQIIRES